MGLANYKMLFQDPEFLGALKNTVVFVLVAVVLKMCIRDRHLDVDHGVETPYQKTLV